MNTSNHHTRSAWADFQCVAQRLSFVYVAMLRTDDREKAFIQPSLLFIVAMYLYCRRFFCSSPSLVAVRACMGV